MLKESIQYLQDNAQEYEDKSEYQEETDAMEEDDKTYNTTKEPEGIVRDSREDVGRCA